MTSSDNVVLEAALDTPPHLRTREQLKALVGDYASKVEALDFLRKQNQELLDKYPVEVDPAYLQALKERSSMLERIEVAVSTNMRPGQTQTRAQALLDYLVAGHLRGIRF